MDVLIAPFAQVSPEAREKEADAGGIAPEANHVQHRSAQRGLRKLGGVHK
jgi:hypothetical protein